MKFLQLRLHKSLCFFSSAQDLATSHQTESKPIWDNKTCEFEYAANGMIGLQTSFAVVNQLLNKLSEIKLADLLGNNARRLFNLSNNTIEIGGIADFTLFTKEGSSTLTKEINKRKIKEIHEDKKSVLKIKF
jgi:dihydroorotase